MAYKFFNKEDYNLGFNLGFMIGFAITLAFVSLILMYIKWAFGGDLKVWEINAKLNHF